MRSVGRWGLAAMAGAIALLTAGGCSTVILSENSHGDQPAAEHAALVEAASVVALTRWPKPQGASWADRLTGRDGAPRVSESDAATAYVAGLEAPRKIAVLTDAARHVGAARALVSAADAASGAIRPAMADVSVIENAIADLRQTRDVYLASLKLIEREGEAVVSAETRKLKSDFADVIEDLGAAADRLADEAENDPTRTFAGPSARFVN